MGIIEQATKRLEELNRSGVAVPWAAAGLAGSNLQAQVEAEACISDLGKPKASQVERMVRPTPEFAEPSVAPILRSTMPMPQPANDAGPSVELDLARLERMGFLVPALARSPLAEEFRQVKRPLLRNARAKDGEAQRMSLIMVTSAIPGEGKTFSAINLALSLASEIDTSVLLVDADVVRPGVMQRLGVSAERGLLDLLTDSTLTLEDVVLKTNIPKFSVLPAGRRNQFSTELLASAAMKDVLVALAATSSNRIAVFDSPPLLLTSEAKVLAGRVGQVILVVEAETTRRSVVAQALAAVEHCPNVVCLLNKATSDEAPLGYGYY